MNDQPHLLIVDDDEGVRTSFALWLETEGFHIHTASHGDAAAAFIEREAVVVCLVDLKLGEEDGFQVVRRLAALNTHVKFLIITAYPGYDTAITALKSGIFDYLSKAEDNETILGKIQAAVAAHADEARQRALAGAEKTRLALICRRELVAVGLRAFCQEQGAFHLTRVYHRFEQMRPQDFDPGAALCFICGACHGKVLLDAGTTMLERIKSVYPEAKPVVLDAQLSDDDQLNLLQLGVRGFIAPNMPTSVMKDAVAAVIEGGIWAPKHTTDRLLTSLLQGTVAPKPRRASFHLTPRELEVLQAMAAGLSNAEIAARLFLSEKTVKTHAHKIFRKMGVDSRVQAVVKAGEAFLL